MTSRLILWGFVAAVTVLDVAFAWAHQHSFAEWEMNPVATSVASHLGLPAVLAYRLLSVALGAIVINLAGRSVRDVGSALVFTVHLALLGIYVHGYAV